MSARRRKVLVIFGTRPDAIKMCPLVHELKSRPSLDVSTCVTGQHRDMLQTVLDCFKLVPDHDLAIMRDRQSLFDVTGAVLSGIKPILDAENPDVVLVHGDTSTAYISALSSFYLHIPVGHVEAGLRTHDMNSPFPEEFNRQSIALVASLHFAPTQAAQDNLLREGHSADRTFVTGNTVLDALKYTVRADFTHPILDWAKGGRLVVLTAHRRENLGEPLARIFSAVKKLASDFPDIRIVYPVHMNPQVRQPAHGMLDGIENVLLAEPLDVLDFHNIMARAELILTDSGGIQEEAPALGIPTLVLRDTTERPEGVEAGCMALVGTDETVIYDEAARILRNRSTSRHGARDEYLRECGGASARIADILERAAL